jgi:hypothetical protein
MQYNDVMSNANEKLAIKIHEMLPSLNERQQRLYLAAEAKALGHGGITKISKISGVSRVTITEGVRELESDASRDLPVSRCRKKGGGRKNYADQNAGFAERLEQMVEPHTKGDPMDNHLRWVSKSLRNLEADLKNDGFDVSHMTIAKELRKQEYTLQGNRKDISIVASHPDRNAQFEYINKQCGLFYLKGYPVLSVATKKKENIGNFKNRGQEYRKKGEAQKVLDHDFPLSELGKATPYGVYEIFRDAGFVNVGISKDTAEFSVESIRKWWSLKGNASYPQARELLITADCGGSNGYRVRLWKAELQILANELNKKITVLHFPPGTSKWNKIEHRLFSFISKNWRGQPLLSMAVIVNLIGATKTKTGLSVDCVVDDGVYEKGVEVTDEEFKAIKIKLHKFHGEWNYTILPQKKNEQYKSKM